MTERQHAESTPEVPSVASILAGMVLMSWAILTTVYVALGLDDGTLGTLLGVILSLALLGQVYGRIVRRGSAGVERALDQAELDDRADRWGPYEDFAPAWNQATCRYPAELYPEAHCAPGIDPARSRNGSA